MDLNNKEKISIVIQKRINVEGGDVLHVLKSDEKQFAGFQEAYFSTIKYNYIKAWKRHMKMTMNLIVPIGKVQFIFYSHSGELIKNVIIGEENFCRITVPPEIWFGFKGLSENDSYILNISNIKHNPNEIERESINKFPFI